MRRETLVDGQRRCGDCDAAQEFDSSLRDLARINSWDEAGRPGDAARVRGICHRDDGSGIGTRDCVWKDGTGFLLDWSWRDPGLPCAACRLLASHATPCQ